MEHLGLRYRFRRNFAQSRLMRHLICPCLYDPGVRLKFTHLLPLGHHKLLSLMTEVRQQPCPHCQRSETLIRHGYSSGYHAHGHQREVRRFRFFAPTAINAKAVAGPSPSSGVISWPAPAWPPASFLS